MRFILYVFLLVLPFCVTAQKQNGFVAAKVAAAKAAKVKFERSSVFSVSSRSNASKYASEVSDAMILEPAQVSLTKLVQQAPEALSMQLQVDEPNLLTLELVKFNIFSDNFKAQTSDGRDITNTMDRGVHYYGIVRGQEASLVSISVFNNEVVGSITSAEGSFTLGKLRDDSGQHIVYRNGALNAEEEFKCATLDDDIVYTPEKLRFNPAGSRMMPVVEVDIEAGQSVYNAFSGNLTNTTNFLTGVFAQSYVLYANAGITMMTSELNLWQTADPYTSGSSSGQLTLFKNNTSMINGDISHLVEVQNIGGVAAGFNGLCSPNVDDKLCFSGFSGTSFQTVPTYSFNVMLITHEMGHLLGSRHTHACVWNGNGTAIDGCSGFTEGNCVLPPSPMGGGTIMSYCHNDPVGINFAGGFGPQPTAVINNAVNNNDCCPSNVQIFSNQAGGVCTGTNVAYEVVVAGGNGTYTYAWCAYDNGNGANPCLTDFTPSGAVAAPSRVWNGAGGQKSVKVTITQAGCTPLESYLHVFDVINNDNVCNAAPLILNVAAGANGTCATVQMGEVNPGAGSPNACTSQNGWCSGGAEPGVQNSLWYTFTAPTSGIVDVYTDTNDDAQLAIWSVGDCNNFATFTEIAANDDKTGSIYSPYINNACVVPGQTYYVQIDGFEGFTYKTNIFLKEEPTGLTITCPADINVTCSGLSTDPVDTGMATASTTTCCTAPVITHADVNNMAGTITRTWTATYACGQVLTCTQKIYNGLFQTLTDGPYENPGTWVSGCMPSNTIMQGQTVVMQHNVTNSANMVLTNNGNIQLMSGKTFTNLGTFKGNGVVTGDFINGGIFSLGN